MERNAIKAPTLPVAALAGPCHCQARGALPLRPSAAPAAAVPSPPQHFSSVLRSILGDVAAGKPHGTVSGEPAVAYA